MKLDFNHFTTGALFLVRTPRSFPEGYADNAFYDMKHNLHFDFAALLETWNCMDGVLWKSDRFPRSSYWKDEERDPLEECFDAADRHDMAFLAEAGVMDDASVQQHRDGMFTSYDGRCGRNFRIGLAPSCPFVLEYLIAKYDALLDRFAHHPSCQGVCLPAENSSLLSYDRYSREAYRKMFGAEMPSPREVQTDIFQRNRTLQFCEETFLEVYRKLARHIKQKYGILLMHYPPSLTSALSHCQPLNNVVRGRSLNVVTKIEDLDVLNLQTHPPLSPDPYFFKMETEYMLANTNGKPCISDTHFYHEMSAGRLPDLTPKRFLDWILSTLTPFGISFFSYAFMSDAKPVWSEDFLPGQALFDCYLEQGTIAARREMCLKGMGFVEQLKPMLDGTRHFAECAVYYPEQLDVDGCFGSYPLEHMFGCHELFNAAAIPIQFVKEIPSSPDAVKCIVLTGVRELPENEIRNMKQYLANRGKVIVLGNCGESVLKLCGLQVSASSGQYLVEEPDGFLCRVKLPLDPVHYTETNHPAILRYDNGEAAVTRSEQVMFVGCSCAVDVFSYYRNYHFADIWRKLMLDWQCCSGVCFESLHLDRKAGHQFISADLYRNQKKCLLLLRNFGVALDHSSLDWRLSDGMMITKTLADGKPFDFTNGGQLPKIEYFAALLAERAD